MDNSERKSVPKGLIPFRPGPNPLRGKGPPKGQGGRPPDQFRAMMRQLASRPATLRVLKAILDGELGTKVLREEEDEQGKKVVIMVVDGDLYLKAHAHATKQGYGDPKQAIEVTGMLTVQELAKLTDEELDQRARSLGLIA